MPHRKRTLALCAAPSTFVLLFAGAPQAGPAVGKEAPLRLPGTIAFTDNPDSPAAVFFRHTTHAALAQNRCLNCHPATFRILKREYRPAHETMNAGQGCGSCHDGKQAFGTTDDAACAQCHTGSEPIDPLARSTVVARSPESPGSVTFSHKVHVAAAGRCASCHPSPFAMTVSAKTRAAGAMHDRRACGACHNGEIASSVDDACDGCHREEVKP